MNLHMKLLLPVLVAATLVLGVAFLSDRRKDEEGVA